MFTVIIHMYFFLGQFVKNRFGKNLAIVDGYTFYGLKGYNQSQNWWCFKCGKCNARFMVFNNGQIKKAQMRHNHEPQSYKITDGIYYRV